MWRLDYQECSITKEHRKYYFFRDSLISKLITLRDNHYEMIDVTTIGKSQPVDDCKIYYLDIKECSITFWRRKYFANKKKLQRGIKWFKKRNWEEISMPVETTVAKMFENHDTGKILPREISFYLN